MPRIPYVPADIPGPIPDLIRSRRGPTGLLELDRTLLHNPSIAEGWNALMGAIRSHTSLPATVREMAILRVAVLNKAQYEWDQHVGVAREAGMTQPQLDAIRSGDLGMFDAAHAVTIRYTDAMTRDVEVGDGLFEEVKALFGDKGAFELTETIAAYNMVSRLLVALKIGY
ncbi:hypothetical protein HK101_009207 [Irineochytrium annulatum]|nr:hypothetical protein HK101_009207 [Irineochytrium annulatum]